MTPSVFDRLPRSDKAWMIAEMIVSAEMEGYEEYERSKRL